MDSSTDRQMLIVIRQPPYGSSLARASLDAALATAAFGHPVSLLFMGDGVLQLLDGQQSKEIGNRNIGKLLTSLPLYDIESVYVDALALSRYGITTGQLVLPVRALDTAQLQQMLRGHDHLVGC